MVSLYRIPPIRPGIHEFDEPYDRRGNAGYPEPRGEQMKQPLLKELIEPLGANVLACELH